MTHIAYIINQYPKISHSFIRREILAVEALGHSVSRFSIRGWDEALIDANDISEQQKTHYTMKRGFWRLMGDLIRFARHDWKRFWPALKLVFGLSRKSYRPLPYHVVYLAHACQISQKMRDQNIDHIHAHFGTNSAEIALLAHVLTDLPYSYTVHGMDEADNAQRLALETKTANSKFTVTISDYTRSQLMRVVAPEFWDKIKVVHCGLPNQSFADTPAGFPNDPVFLCIGRLSPEKGHLILLDAFAKVRKKIPSSKLVLVGDGDMRGQIMAKINRMGLMDHVRMTGWVDTKQVVSEIQCASAIVQPSFIEGLPVVIMEALAQHRPVISTFIAGIPELVIPNENGWLVPAGNIDQLAEAMSDCAEAPHPVLARMGENGYRRAKKRHFTMTEAEKLLALVNQ